MSDVEKARELFHRAGLSFPTIPENLAARLTEREKWLFSTREIDVSPYLLDHYVNEVAENDVADYAILAHSGHGINSYAIQYYLAYDALRMFLSLGWGGVYMDAEEAAAQIQDCFSVADEVASLAPTAEKLHAGGLTIVGSDFYGSYWIAPGERHREIDAYGKRPADVLSEALCWLRSR